MKLFKYLCGTNNSNSTYKDEMIKDIQKEIKTKKINSNLEKQDLLIKESEIL